MTVNRAQNNTTAPANAGAVSCRAFSESRFMNAAFADAVALASAFLMLCLISLIGLIASILVLLVLIIMKDTIVYR